MSSVHNHFPCLNHPANSEMPRPLEQRGYQKRPSSLLDLAVVDLAKDRMILLKGLGTRFRMLASGQ